MKRLTREQMKRVAGGGDFGTCTANCPPGLTATCSGFDSCSFYAGVGEFDGGVICTSGNVSKDVVCAGDPQGTLG